MSLLLLLSDDASPGADVSFNGPMLALPASLQRLGFTYTRNSAKTVYQGNALVTLAANQFGTTYDAVTGLHAYEPEPAATNLATNSEGAAATWTVSNVTDAGTPISGFAASLAFGDNSAQRTAYKILSVTSGTTYAVSVFVQMDDGLAPVVGTSPTIGDFRFVVAGNAVISQATVVRVSGSLYRCSVSAAATSTASLASGLIKYTGSSSRTFRIAGIQVETGSRATSYIATDGSTRTRAADVLSCAVANIPGFNPAGYTLVVDARIDALTGAIVTLANISDATGANRAVLRITAAGTFASNVLSGSADQGTITETSAGVIRNKLAYSVAANSFLRAINGVSGTADIIGLIPVAPTTFNVGHYLGTAQLNGYIYGFKLITTALNQEQTTGQTT